MARPDPTSGGPAARETAFFSVFAPTAERLRPDRSTVQREWCERNLRGLMNLFLPSFLEDFQTLDEEAIRRDVNQAIAHGFSGTLPMVNWTVPGDPRWEQFHRIIIDEAAGRLPVHGIVFNAHAADDRALIAALEKLGVELVLLAPRHRPDIDAHDLHASMKDRITATGLPIMLYAALGEGRNFAHLGPAGQPLEIYDRLADLPNVTSMKISQPVSLLSTMQLCARLGDRLSMGPVNLDFLPLLARHIEIGWSGQWNAEAVQTPALPLGSELLQASLLSDFRKLDRTARQLQPVLDRFFAIQAHVIRKGAHPWAHMRYYSWLSGGNGGLLPPDPHAPAGTVPVLDAQARRRIRSAFAASGLPVTDDPEEQFVVGRAAWARGVRVSALSALPNYSVE